MDKDYGISFTVSTDMGYTEDELVMLVNRALATAGISHGPVVSSRKGIRGRRKKELKQPALSVPTVVE